MGQVCPTVDGFIGTLMHSCKYGENAWQQPAGLYSTGSDDALALHHFEIVEGTSPSYNNWCDTERLLQTMTHIAAALRANGFAIPGIALGAKHGNVCGAAISPSFDVALRKMLSGDPLAIFGGLVMTNFEIGAAEADELVKGEGESKRLLDGVISSGFDEAAREKLHRKGGKCRLIQNEALGTDVVCMLDVQPRFRYVRGGFLLQPNYHKVLVSKSLDISMPAKFNAATERDVLLAWAIGSTSNSNTITLVRDGKLLGNGVGQQDRVGAAELAIKRAARSGHDLAGAVAYSDSFFPFPDAVEVLIKAGITTILTSSGSVNDKLTREVCQSAGVNLLMIPDAEGRGFFGH
ncbi:MAG: hypothetical protein DA330_10615 [Nitrososphaera sp.]|nr:hypothetical protein [Nitrososphaera sp.]